MSQFTKVAAIIQSCNTEAQWKVAEQVVYRYEEENMRKYKSGIINFSQIIERCNAGTSLRAYLSDKLVDIVGAPQRWKIGVRP